MDKRITELFTSLHSCPELSGNEKKTMATLSDFLRRNTHLTIHDMGSWLCAVHTESTRYKTIAFRADMDAIKTTGGKAFHGCGHDGHMTTMCALALEIDNITVGKNIVFIFQPSEEDGKGAEKIAPHLKDFGIRKIYGFHNIPGYPEGMPLLREGTFACASTGLNVTFMGSQAHAAYPETGKNPSYAIARLISFIEEITNENCFDGMVLATIVHVSIGEENAFGVSAGHGSVSVTVRAEHEWDLVAFVNKITICAGMAGFKYEVEVNTESFDSFPETCNPKEDFDTARARLEKSGISYEVLESPMRWSEDFGHYLKVRGGLFIGIGAGQEHSALHTDTYSYNTDIIDKSVRVLRTIADI